MYDPQHRVSFTVTDENKKKKIRGLNYYGTK